ncbi:MAG TPA: group I intron-associated PD-(D/E)XK endonuclease [Mucilaginibacter sp.]|jgi:hypothetical protein
MNTKLKGNKAEAVVISAFVKKNIPVLLPFGDNEKYDIVIEVAGVFKSVQIKYGRFKNGCVEADIKHRIGFKRIKYSNYKGKVDYIAIWCEDNDKVYLLDSLYFSNKTRALLRIDHPKNNSSHTTVKWAKDYEIEILFP